MDEGTPIGAATRDKMRDLERRLDALFPLCVAFSGGVDSAFLLAAAAGRSDRRLLAVTGISPAVPAAQREAARRIAASLGVEHALLKTDELGSEAYRRNGPDRCFVCKDTLYTAVRGLLDSTGRSAFRIADGTNADDAHDFRPGMKAARGHEVTSPLLESALTKSEIRALSRDLGLETWDAPASPCLSSRFPVNTEIRVEDLVRVERAEACLRSLGFRELRVRHHGTVARIEVPEADMPLLLDETLRRRAVDALTGLGYAFVALDLAGFRSGSLNVLVDPARRAVEREP